MDLVALVSAVGLVGCAWPKVQSYELAEAAQEVDVCVLNVALHPFAAIVIG